MPSTMRAKRFKVQQDYTTLLIPHWYRTAGPTVGTTKIISHLPLLPTVLCSDSWNLDLEEQDIHFPGSQHPMLITFWSDFSTGSWNCEFIDGRDII